MSIRNESIFPRDPNGNRDNSIVKANEQLTQAFSDSPSSNGPAKGNSFILNALLKLITQLIMLLENRETPSKTDSKKEVPSKPDTVVEKEKPEKPKSWNKDVGARGVYGGPVGWTGPAKEKETPSKPDPEREIPSKTDSKKEVPSKPELVMEKEKTEKPKAWNVDVGARGVYGGPVGWTGPAKEKETPNKPDPEVEKEKPEPKPEKSKPQNGGEGARGVYGGAIGWTGPAQEKETPSKPEPEIEKEKPEPEKSKPQNGEEGARGVYGGAIGWTGSAQKK